MALEALHVTCVPGLRAALVDGGLGDSKGVGIAVDLGRSLGHRDDCRVSFWHVGHGVGHGRAAAMAGAGGQFAGASVEGEPILRLPACGA